MFHDSRYGEECSHGHGWYFFEDGCAIAGCENAPEIIHIDNEGVVRKSTVLRDPEPECTGKTPGGGVPEQGLRDAAQRALDAYDDRVANGMAPMGKIYSMELLRAALERPRPVLPEPEPPHSPWEVERTYTRPMASTDNWGPGPYFVVRRDPGEWCACSLVEERANAVRDALNALASGAALPPEPTPKLSRHLQTLSTALMILDQKRVTGPVPMDGDTFTWKERADKAEAELARLRGAALSAPEPPTITTAMLAAALDDVFETTQWEGKGASIAPGLYAALKSQLGAALPPPEFKDGYWSNVQASGGLPPQSGNPDAGPIRWCKHEECKAERHAGAMAGSDYCVDHDPKLRAWKAIEWAIALLEIHDGVKVNPNSQWWLAELRAAQTLVDSGPQTGNPPPDEIEKLRAENARFRGALEDVALVPGGKAAERIRALLRGNL